MTSIDVVQVSLLSTLNITSTTFTTLIQCFYLELWTIFTWWAMSPFHNLCLRDENSENNHCSDKKAKIVLGVNIYFQGDHSDKTNKKQYSPVYFPAYFPKFQYHIWLFIKLAVIENIRSRWKSLNNSRALNKKLNTD